VLIEDAEGSETDGKLALLTLVVGEPVLITFSA